MDRGGTRTRISSLECMALRALRREQPVIPDLSVRTGEVAGPAGSRARRRSAWVVIASLTLTGCMFLTDPDHIIEPAVIDPSPATDVIRLPYIVTAGVPFRLHVYSVGNTCVAGTQRTDVRMLDTIVEIRPYHRRRRKGGCLDIGLTFDHPVDLRLDRPGPTTIKVIAAQRGGAPVELDWLFVVQPPS
jgi:hypothetical protein